MTDLDSRWDAYRTAVVRVSLPGGPIEVAPAPAACESIGDFPFDPDATVHIITAYDSSLADVAANEQRNAALLTDLEAHGVVWHPAVGADPEWVHQEASFAVLGLSREQAIELACRYAQDAIFEWTRQWWRLVDCSPAGAGAVESTHWTVQTLGD